MRLAGLSARVLVACGAGDVTTKTLPNIRWQAALPDGIGHAWADGWTVGAPRPLRTVAAPRPLCGADIRPVEERHAWPVVAKCVLCLGREMYGSRN